MYKFVSLADPNFVPNLRIVYIGAISRAILRAILH